MLLVPPFTTADKAQLKIWIIIKKKKRTGKTVHIRVKCCFFFPGSVPGQSDPGLGPVIGLRSQVEKVWSCYCCAFFIRASASWRKETETEGGEEGAEGECVVLKWRILVHASSATAHRKTPLFLWELAQLPAVPLVVERRHQFAGVRGKAGGGSCIM